MRSQGLSSGCKMSQKHDGVFSASLMSLQLQLKSLLDEAGGEQTLTLLDKLSTLSSKEQKTALSAFINVVNKISLGDKRFMTPEDAALQDLEENLFNDIVSAMEEAERAPVRAALSGQTARKLEVLDGGKHQHEAESQKSAALTPIDFNKARKNRKCRSTPCLN